MHQPQHSAGPAALSRSVALEGPEVPFEVGVPDERNLAAGAGLIHNLQISFGKRVRAKLCPVYDGVVTKALRAKHPDASPAEQVINAQSRLPQ